MPECKLCGKTLYYLTQHLIAVHGIDGKEYRCRFPNARLCDPGQNKKSKGPKVTCPFCKRRMRYITPRHLKLHGVSPQEFKEQFPKSPRKAKDVKAKCSAKARVHIGKQLEDPKFIKALRRGIEKTRAICEADPEFRERRLTRIVNTSPHWCRHYLDSQLYRSRYELVLAVVFEVEGLDWEYEPRPPIPYKDENGKARMYYPDFRVGEHLMEFRPKVKQGVRLQMKKKATKGLRIVDEKDIDHWKLRPLVNHLIYVELRDQTRHTTLTYWKDYIARRGLVFKLPKWLRSVKH